MKKIRDTVAILNVGTYTQEESQELQNIKNNLTTHIKEIRNSYQGIDAETIIAKLLEVTNKLDSVITNLNYYGQYMKQVSNQDSDSLNTSKSDFDSLASEVDTQDTSLETDTLSLDLLNEDLINGGNQNE